MYANQRAQSPDKGRTAEPSPQQSPTPSSMVLIATSSGCSGSGSQLSLSCHPGSGNGPFGFGWGLSFPSITRKTYKELLHYRDPEESDVYILSGAEDLVAVLRPDGTGCATAPTRTTESC